FQTASAIHFDASEAAPRSTPASSLPGGSAKPPDLEAGLPAQLRITVALTSPIDDSMAVGSLLTGRVVGAGMQKRSLLVPDGAPIEGRIRRLERYSGARDYFVVAVEFTRIRSSDKDYRFYADLLNLDGRQGVEMAYSRENRSYDVTSPGAGLVLQQATVE